jgi:hypothetical protein
MAMVVVAFACTSLSKVVKAVGEQPLFIFLVHKIHDRISRRYVIPLCPTYLAS